MVDRGDGEAPAGEANRAPDMKVELRGELVADVRLAGVDAAPVRVNEAAGDEAVRIDAEDECRGSLRHGVDDELQRGGRGHVRVGA